MTKIGIIRHGRTEWNKEGRAQGSSDIPLNEDGLFEARRLAKRLSGENWNVIYSSNLLRAKQTADIIGEKLGQLDVRLDSRIREVGGGLIEGTTEEERLTKWGSAWRDLDLGREKRESVIDRGLSFLEEIVKEHENENVLIVTHGSFIYHLLDEIVPELIREEKPKNTSVTKLLKKDDGWGTEIYNCTLHLEIEG
ncbi:histidine phosphatase family protein [Bacillus sp. 31A1R]|uniref:Histidine phosphatase family protein n=1 Tax=Robertmurraya mangrovi TaxID=3098077 RepID=A0ABU5IVT7_9BACI|nr:histidine phosphatase family protein [Bacillus sp. 31A1R]MDZ5471254.1 histidine phosphatase family protein [Bacillus sp. 31A1R]